MILRHRPHDRRAVAEVIVGQWQQREGTGRIENLECDILMGTLVMERADDRGVIVLPARDGDPARLARR